MDAEEELENIQDTPEVDNRVCGADNVINYSNDYSGQHVDVEVMVNKVCQNVYGGNMGGHQLCCTDSSGT